METQDFLCIGKMLALGENEDKTSILELKIICCNTSRKGINLNLKSELYGNLLLLLRF